MPTEHDLKVWPAFFDPLADGTKPFEARKDDRGFAVGDVLHLREYDPQAFDEALQRYSRQIAGSPTDDPEAWAVAAHLAAEAAYTGRTLRRVVTYVLRGGPWLAPGYVVLGLADA